MFKQIVGQSAVIRKGGVYRTCDLYEYRGQLFAKYGSGYIRLNADGSSSVDGTQLDMLAYDGALYKDKFGRLCTASDTGRFALSVDPTGEIKQLPNAGDNKMENDNG